MKKFPRGVILFSALAFALASAPAPAAAADEVYETEHYPLRAVTVADGFDYPWSLAFLPDGRFLVSEREGALRIVEPGGQVGPPVAGLPEIWAEGQGGLLDVALGPDFARDGVIFFTYAEPDESGDEGGTALARARLNAAADALRDVRVLFRQTPKTDGGRHFGSRIVFPGDGTVMFTTGDRGERDRNQDKTVNRGQVIRLRLDGGVPADNGRAVDAALRPEVWSMGHRNPQGAAVHPQTGEIWLHEHGARGGDEINIARRGRNYGWPVIAYGRHYFGGKIGEGAHKPGMEQPVYYWDPSIAPSGMAFYSGGRYPKWKNSLFIGALKFEMIARLTLRGDTVTGEERMLGDMDERIRDVRFGPDGFLYVLIDDSPGRLIRLEPVN
ncbi:MAG: PQQ-dependent sugar dehydrogenase [Rhodospirillales bacterium]